MNLGSHPLAGARPLALVAVALAFGLVAPAAPAATAAPPPSIRYVNEAVALLSDPSLTLTLRRPVVDGVASGVKSSFDAAVDKLVGTELGARTLVAADCAGVAAGQAMVGAAAGFVSAKRYASVVITFRTACKGSSQDSARSFAMDLNTGVRVGLGKFAQTNGRHLDWAVIDRLEARYRELFPLEGSPHHLPRTMKSSDWGYGPEEDKPDPLPAFTTWNVTKSGVTVFFAPGQVAEAGAGLITVPVPWKMLLRPGEGKGKVKTTVWVRKAGWSGPVGAPGSIYLAEVMKVKSRGHRILIRHVYLHSDRRTDGYGVRRAKVAQVFDHFEGGRRAIKFTSTSPTAKPAGKGWRKATAMELRYIRATIDL